MNKPIQTDSTAVELSTITEIIRPDSFCNLLVDSFGNNVSGSVAIPDMSNWERWKERINESSKSYRGR
jgi:hypothetical protein